MTVNIHLVNYKDAVEHFEKPPAWAEGRAGISRAELELSECLAYNPGPFKMEDVVGAIVIMTDASHAFESAGAADWEWIVTLHDGRIFKVAGDHDFSGWECESGATYTELT